MRDDEEESPIAGVPKFTPLPLGTLGVNELHQYIAELKAEIARVEAELKRKQSHLSAADALFRKPPS